MTDPRIATDAALGYLLARVAWMAIEHGMIRPFAAALGREAYHRADALTGDRLPNLPGNR